MSGSPGCSTMAAAAPQLVELDADVLRSGNAFGTYRAARDAHRALEGLAREHRWCFKLLGLESGRRVRVSACRSGRCKGACVGKEPAARAPGARQARPHAAAGSSPGRTRARCCCAKGAGERTQYHVIDGWQHLGTFDGDDDDAIGATRDWRRGRARTASTSMPIASFTRVLRDRRLLPLPSPTSRIDDSWN